MMRSNNSTRCWTALSLGAAVLLLAGCPKPPPPKPKPKPEPTPEIPQGPPPPEDIETGKDCATATTVCDEGVCTATIKNDCDTPVTCDFYVSTYCSGADAAAANAKEPITVLSKKTDEVRAFGDCEGRRTEFTQAEKLVCK